jgi:hypothetical protein
MYSELRCDSDVCAIAARARSFTDALELNFRLPRFLAVAKKAQGATRTDLDQAHMFATESETAKAASADPRSLRIHVLRAAIVWPLESCNQRSLWLFYRMPLI